MDLARQQHRISLKPFEYLPRIWVGVPPLHRPPAGNHPRQSHESVLLTGRVLISAAPEAQRLLAPRFSVVKAIKNSHSAPSGRRKRRLSLRLLRSCDCPARQRGFRSHRRPMPVFSVERVSKMASRELPFIPQGLRPSFSLTFFGTTKVVP